MEFRVLGPVEVLDSERRLDLGGPKQRTVLALLIANAGRSVSTDRLIEAAYGDNPDGARRSVQTYVSTLRSQLGDMITSVSGGYEFTPIDSSVDAQRFATEVEAARALSVDDPESASSGLEAALAIWRGHPFQDVEARDELDAEIKRLNELRLVALESRIDADLASGRDGELVGELDALTVEHPFRESFHSQSMVALYRSGRQAEALRAYSRLRENLAEELGVDPSPTLQELEQRILDQDPTLALSSESRLRRQVLASIDLRAISEGFDRRGRTTQAVGPGIVGRAGPLRRVGEAISFSGQGRRSAVLVSGEAGVGKTSLIRAAIEASNPEVMLVGWGTCWDGVGAPGFWPWIQAFGDLVRTIGTEAAVAAAGQDSAILSVLVRELGPVVETTDDPDRRRLLLLDVAVRWLEALATERHVVVVLDDLHWADSSTLDLLDHVVAAPVAARLLVIGAYRHDELDHTSQSRLATVASHADHVHLEGLTAEGVEELVAAICDPATAHMLAPELHRRTGGHPMFVTELARLPELGAGGPLPTAVTGAVARRFETLPEDSRHVLEAASVLGNRLLPDVLGSVTDESPTEIVRRIAPAIDAGLIQTLPGDEFWFTHDLFRETLYSSLDVSDRSQLHGALGDALEARHQRGAYVSSGDLARHFAIAARTGDPSRAIHWGREAAAEERLRSAFAEAAGHLGRARSAALDAGWSIEPELLLRLLMDEADSRARSGEPGIARSLLLQAAKVAPGPERQADVALAVQRLGGKFAAPRDEIIAQLEAALEAVTGVDLTRQAQLTAALARELQHSVAEDRQRVGALSDQALALGRESNDDDTLAACLLARHDALWEPGTGVERAQLGHEIAVVGNRLGDTDRLAEGLILEANGLLESGSASFRPVLDRWFGLMQARDEPRDRYMVATRRAALALLDGDSANAEALMHEAAGLGELIHEPDTGNVLMSQRVALARARNDPEELKALAIDAVQWWTGAPVLAHAVAAGAYATAGDLDAASREVATVAEAGGWRSEGSYLRSVLVIHLADAATTLGDTELCRHLLADVEHLTDGCGVNGAMVAFAGPFAHAAGILAAEIGDHDRAHTMLQLSIDISRRVGATVWLRESDSAQRRNRRSRSSGPRCDESDRT